MDSPSIFMLLAVVFGFLMAWGIGANDVSNAMGTAVGSRSITIRQAIIIAAIFEFCGALFAGSEVTNTIRQSIISADYYSNASEYFVIGMLATLLAAGIWLIIASIFGWPVSTTHTIVGAIVGFGAIQFGTEAIQWQEVMRIGISWALSPVMGSALAFAAFKSMQLLIFDHSDPTRHAQRVIPFYILLVTCGISLITFSKLNHLGVNLEKWEVVFLSIAFGLSMMMLGRVIIRHLRLQKPQNRRLHFYNVEKLFSVAMVFAACAMAFAHGSNDVANAIGPVAGVVSVINSGGALDTDTTVPVWVLLLGGGGIVTGLATYGHRVIATIGTGITQLTPSRGFAATFATAMTVVMASATGLPISTTHTLVGSILGVGLARGMAAINLRMIRTIVITWFITLPIGAIMAIVFYYSLVALFC